MRPADSIEHKGVVKEVRPGMVRVEILSESACSSCRAKGVCSMSESALKMIDVKTFDTEFTAGQQVVVILKKAAGLKALFLGYLLPFLSLSTTLFIVYAVTKREDLAGIAAVAALIPYYLVLFLLRNKLQGQFIFSLRKI